MNTNTAGEYNAVITGVYNFLRFNRDSNNPSDIDYSVEGLTTLVDACANFMEGRFSCDHGLMYMQWAYNAAIEKSPHMAKEYFYQYSELMVLLNGVQKAARFLNEHAGQFEKMQMAIYDNSDLKY